MNACLRFLRRLSHRMECENGSADCKVAEGLRKVPGHEKVRGESMRTIRQANDKDEKADRNPGRGQHAETGSKRYSVSKATTVVS